MDNPIGKMKSLKRRIDRIEDELVLETLEPKERNTLIKQLDELWNEYEGLLHDTWQDIDPEIFSD